jgi:hypothetical protein
LAPVASIADETGQGYRLRAVQGAFASKYASRSALRSGRRCIPAWHVQKRVVDQPDVDRSCSSQTAYCLGILLILSAQSARPPSRIWYTEHYVFRNVISLTEDVCLTRALRASKERRA